LIDARDVNAEFGKASGGNKADIAGTEDNDFHLLLSYDFS
jgi:hypothetical protein